MTSRGEMLYPVQPQVESTLDSTKLTILSLSKRKKIYPCFFFLRFQLFIRNYLNKLTKILQFQKTNNANRFSGNKQVENLYTIFLSDSILLVYSLQREILHSEQ